MSLFGNKKRSRRNFRKKAADHEEEGEGGGAETNGETNAKASPDPADVPGKRKDPRALLSFGDDLANEGPEFKTKKTSASRRAAKVTEREQHKEKKGKKKKEKVLSSGVGGEVVGSGSESDLEDEEEGGGDQPLSISQQLKGGIIPNAEFIHRVRREREERRQMGGGNASAPSVMPLSTSKKVPMAKGKSRLVREDDNDRSDDSDGEQGGRRRMDAGNQDDAAIKQFQVLQGLEEMGSDSDEETRRWEEEQIQKGVNASAPDQPAAPQPPQLSAIDQSFLVGAPIGYMGGATGYMGGASFTVAPVLSYAGYQKQALNSAIKSLQIPDKLVPITVESLKSRLSNRLRDLRETASAHRRRLEQIVTDLDNSQDEVTRTDGRRGGLGLDYQFYQEMRGYLRDLLGCLVEKVPEIEGMERAVGKVRKERAELLAERRRQDIMDMDKECSQPEVLQVPVIPEVLSRQRRGVEREGRRRRRREARERGGRLEGDGEEHRQGMSSDDELLEMNRLKFENSMSKALSRSDEVFSDVVEDFWKLSLVKQRLEEWKFSFPDSYAHAHIPLYLPQLFSPYVRLQMLTWNPLEADCEDFEDMKWFEVLMFYGFREGVELDPGDPDTKLIPELVDRILVPKITSLVQTVWDPLSATQTRRLTTLVRRLADDYPTVAGDRRGTQSLFAAVLKRLRKATEDDVYIPLFTTGQVENSLSQRAVFYGQQFWSCVKLLGNITEWEGLVSPDALQELVLDGLLNRYLVLSLQTCPPSSLSVVKTEAIISRLPTSWLSDGATVTRPLQGLVSYISQVAGQLHRSSIGQPDHLRQKTRSQVRDLERQLQRLGAHSEASALCKDCNLPSTASS